MLLTFRCNQVHVMHRYFAIAQLFHFSSSGVHAYKWTILSSVFLKKACTKRQKCVNSN
eukprot:c26018_g1_i1 orf=104-277(+)